MSNIQNQIGLLGLGSFSTKYYLEELNRMYNDIHGGFSTCPFKLLNVDFNKLNPFLPNDFPKLEPTTTKYLNELNELEVTKLVVPNITLHETMDRLPLDFNIIHPVDETIKEITSHGIKEVLLLGTRYTMNSEYQRKKFSESNISLTVPKVKEIEFVDQLRKDIYNGKDSTSQMDELNELVNNCKEKMPVVLACTELSIVSKHVEGQLFDMVDLQIKSAIDHVSKVN